MKHLRRINATPPHVRPGPAEARRVVILLNPTAGARPRAILVDQLVEALKRRGMQIEVVADAGEFACRIVEQEASEGLRAVVAAGGDGTVRHAVECSPPGTPVAILPLGTENLLARYLGLDGHVERLSQTVCEGRTIQLDAARAGERLFLLMAGFGFDAEVVRQLHLNRRGHIHHLSYAKPILRSLRSYEYPQIRVYCGARHPGGDEGVDDLQQQEIRACWAFVSNLPMYACRLPIAPRASGTDGLLDVCTFRRGSWWRGLYYMSHVMMGRHHSLADCNELRRATLRVESDVPVPYQLDGDFGGYLPVEIRVEPRRLTMLVPPESTRGIGNG